MNKQKDGGETRRDEKGHVTKSYEMQRKGILTVFTCSTRSGSRTIVGLCELAHRQRSDRSDSEAVRRFRRTFRGPVTP